MCEWMVEKVVKGNTTTEWNGYHLLPGFEPAKAKYAFESFIPKPEDVLVATFGKTGL